MIKRGDINMEEYDGVLMTRPIPKIRPERTSGSWAHGKGRLGPTLSFLLSHYSSSSRSFTSSLSLRISVGSVGSVGWLELDKA